MGTRYPNPRIVKIHRSYTVEEVATLLGKHKNTVRDWIKRGLPALVEKRPTLILGGALRKFLDSKRAAGKRPCQPGEMYCFGCRAPRKPAGNMADYVPLTDTLGKLIALCPGCGKLMSQHASIAKIERFQGFLDITTTQVKRHIVEIA